MDEMKTPGGGIRRKKSRFIFLIERFFIATDKYFFLKTRLERKEALFKKKRARSALNKNVQSIDMGLYPQESVSLGLKHEQKFQRVISRNLRTMMDSSPAQCGGSRLIR